MTLLPALLLTAATAAEPGLSWQAALTSELQVRPWAVPAGSWVQDLTLPAGVTRNQTGLRLAAQLRQGPFWAQFDGELVAVGPSQDVQSIGDLSRQDQVSPVRFDLVDAWFEAPLGPVPGLSLRVGQQRLQDGVGDRFNPTDNLSADDLEDPLRFGDFQGNAMVRLDLAPSERWSARLVAVPVFKPALLPDTAPLGWSNPAALPWQEETLRWRVLSEQGLQEDGLGYPTVISGSQLTLPETTLANVQLEARLGGSFGPHELALGLYRGFLDFPVVTGQHTTAQVDARCNPADPADCVEGMLLTELTLGFPRVHVLGFNASGPLTPAESRWPLHYRAELALLFPERQTVTLTQDELDLGFITAPAGEVDYGLEGERPTSLSDQPYLKWVLGFDLPLGDRGQAGLQWVHGLPDEHGAGAAWQPDLWVSVDGGVDTGLPTTTSCALEGFGETCAWERTRPRVGDYLALSGELRLKGTTLGFLGLVDLVGHAEEHVVDWSRERVRHGPLSPQGFSALLLPQVSQALGDRVTLAAGALLLLGGPESRFGEPAAGGTRVFLRGRYSF